MSTRQHLHTAIVLFFCQSLGAGFGFAAMLLITSRMPPAAFGTAMSLISIAALVSVLATLNEEAGAMRFLSRGTPGLRAGYLRSTRNGTLFRSLVLGLACLGLFSFVSPIEPISTGAAVITSVLIGALALVRLLARQIAALGRPLHGTVPRILCRPLAFLGLGLVAWSIGTVLTTDLMLTVLLAGLLVALILQALALKAASRGTEEATTHSSEWRQTGMRLMPGLFLLEYFRDLAVVTVALILPAREVGHLSLAFAIAALPGFAVIAAEMAFAPRIAALHGKGAMGRARSAMATSALVRVGGLSICCLGLYLGMQTAGGLLPNDYAGVEALIWPLVCLSATRAIMGNPIAMLTLAGKARTVFRLTLISLPPLVTGIALAAATLHTMAAVIAMVAGHFVIHVLLWRVSLRQTGFDTSILAAFGLRRQAAAPGRKSQDPAGAAQ